MDAETVAHGSPDADHAHAHAGSSVVQIRLGLDKSGMAFTIVNKAVHDTLTNPIVHGSLPPKWPTIIDPILARDSTTWTDKDKKELAACFSWALQNLK